MQWHQVADVESWDSMDVAYCDMNALNHPTWGPAFRHRPLIDAADGVLRGDKLANWRETISNPLDNDFWQAIHFTDEEYKIVKEINRKIVIKKLITISSLLI